MKKIIFTLTFIMLAMISTVILVNAAELPVKDIASFSYGDYNVAVLTGAGDVYLTTDVIASSKKFIETDVTAIISKWDVAAETLYMIKSNGTMSVVTTLKSDEREVKVNNYPISVKEIINLDPLCYIDNKSNIVCDPEFQSEGESKKVLSNVKSFASGGQKKYVVLNDNNLYSIELDYYGTSEVTTTFVMSDVYAVYSGYGNAYALKNNGDLYYLKPDMPTKVVSNVKKENGVFLGSRAVGIINTSNQLYISSHDLGTTKYQGENIKSVAWDTSAGNSFYAVSNDGKAYEGNIFWEKGLSLLDMQSNKVGNCITIGGTIFYFNQEGIYLNLKNGKYNPVYDFGSVTFVKDISVSYSTSYYVFINSTGDVWATDSNRTKTISTTLGNKPIKLFFNNKEVELTLKLQTVNNRTMYPFRECLAAMGASVMWDSENKIAIGELPGYKIEFPIGKSEYWVNGVRHKMDASAYVDASIGRTYIPLRYAAEGLGFNVNWTAGKTENKITISK
ncbi:MAG: stalk domain-containing protein [Bacillota bacterium]|nr:stalk domain-containing protein [Bacillota bacterium]